VSTDDPLSPSEYTDALKEKFPQIDTVTAEEAKTLLPTKIKTYDGVVVIHSDATDAAVTLLKGIRHCC
jgi:hypothetical protein